MWNWLDWSYSWTWRDALQNVPVIGPSLYLGEEAAEQWGAPVLDALSDAWFYVLAGLVLVAIALVLRMISWFT